MQRSLQQFAAALALSKMVSGQTAGCALTNRYDGFKTLPLKELKNRVTDERCFVAYTQMWAYKAPPERVRQLTAIDYHASTPTRVRAAGPSGRLSQGFRHQARRPDVARAQGTGDQLVTVHAVALPASTASLCDGNRGAQP